MRRMREPADGGASSLKTVAEPRQLYPTRVPNLKDVLGPYRQAEDLERREEGSRKAAA